MKTVILKNRLSGKYYLRGAHFTADLEIATPVGVQSPEYALIKHTYDFENVEEIEHAPHTPNAGWRHDGYGQWILKLSRTIDIRVFQQHGQQGDPTPRAWQYVLPWGRSKAIFTTADNAKVAAERHAVIGAQTIIDHLSNNTHYKP